MTAAPPSTESRPFPACRTDRWLERWLPLLHQRCPGAPILEIGCGTGEDSVTLAAAGFTLTAFDLDAAAVLTASERVPKATFLHHDTRHALPCAPESQGAAIASLSLHYFPWTETEAIVGRIHAALGPGGLLLCRVNSTEDHHYGASGHPEIEPHYYSVDGEAKRFFDRRDLERLFAQGWHTLACTHYVTEKYALPKAAWEIVVEKRTI